MQRYSMSIYGTHSHTLRLGIKLHYGQYSTANCYEDLLFDFYSRDNLSQLLNSCDCLWSGDFLFLFIHV